MREKRTEFRELVYELVCGNLELDDKAAQKYSMIKDEFREGSECTLAYNRMLDAYSRICLRQQEPEWEDPDVEIIINELMDMGKRIALKMFDYGILFGGQSNS